MTSISYLIYIACSIFITIIVAQTLSKNGKVYLVDGFNGDEAFATSVNHMLVVGFYLLNLGFVLLRMQTDSSIDSVEQMIVYLSSGLGFVLMALGAIHFFNMYLIHKFRARQLKEQHA
jgi:hypothetical protein